MSPSVYAYSKDYTKYEKDMKILQQGQAIFSEQGPDETFGSSPYAGVTNEIPKVTMYTFIHNTLYKNFIENI